jgi:copper chaperone NosL
MSSLIRIWGPCSLLYLLCFHFWRSCSEESNIMKGSNGIAPLLFVGLLLMAGCTSKPEPILFGTDVCSYCKMIITDPRFGAELVTAKGRIYKYDAAECMIAHIHEEKLEYSSLLAIAYDRPKELHLVDSLSFVQSPDYRGPMGNTAAFLRADSLVNLQGMRWEDLFRKESTTRNK